MCGFVTYNPQVVPLENGKMFIGVNTYALYMKQQRRTVNVQRSGGMKGDLVGSLAPLLEEIEEA